MSDFNLIKFKRDLRNTLVSLYLKKGYAHTKASIQLLLKQATAKAKAQNQPELGVQVRGECCEILLELELWEFIRVNKLPWITSKGLCIERTDHKRNKTTELDLTLFTPGKIVLFESKYRQGDITLTDTCTIVPKWGHVTDVYKQNLMHLTNLKDNFADAIISFTGVKPFAITLYVESILRVKDNRTSESKRLVPLVGTENIYNYLKTIQAIKQQVWNMNKVRQIVSTLDSTSAVNFERHMKEVAHNGKPKYTSNKK